MVDKSGFLTSLIVISGLFSLFSSGLSFFPSIILGFRSFSRFLFTLNESELFAVI